MHFFYFCIFSWYLCVHDTVCNKRRLIFNLFIMLWSQCWDGVLCVTQRWWYADVECLCLCLRVGERCWTKMHYNNGLHIINRLLFVHHISCYIQTSWMSHECWKLENVFVCMHTPHSWLHMFSASILLLSRVMMLSWQRTAEAVFLVVSCKCKTKVYFYKFYSCLFTIGDWCDVNTNIIQNNYFISRLKLSRVFQQIMKISSCTRQTIQSHLKLLRMFDLKWEFLKKVSTWAPFHYYYYYTVCHCSLLLNEYFTPKLSSSGISWTRMHIAHRFYIRSRNGLWIAFEWWLEMTFVYGEQYLFLCRKWVKMY